MQPKSIVAVLESLSAAKDAPLTKALTLADWYGSDLYVVHANPSNALDSGGRDAAHGQLMEHVSRTTRASGVTGVNIIPAVLPGSPVAAIAEYSSDVGADLIVVGRDARRGHWPGGSFAIALGKAAKRPTMAVNGDDERQAASPALFRNIVVAIDFSDASFRALSAAVILAQQSGGQLTLLHVVDGFPYETVYSASRAFRLVHGLRGHVDRITRELRALIPADASHWADIDVAAVSGTAHEAIIEQASARRADLIVLGVPRRPRLEEVVAGSTVQRVVRRADIPVLLVPGAATPRLLRPMNERDSALAHHPIAFGWPPIGHAASPAVD